MPSSSSHRSGSCSSGSTNEEPKRRKRYSLRIEFLDDDDDIELDRSRETVHQQRRSDRRAPLSQQTSNGRPEGSQNTSQRSRRSSVSSTTAIVGTGNRGGPPVAATRPPLVRGQHGETRTHGTHTSQHAENHASTVDQLTRDFTRQMTVKDPSDADLTSRFQQQMSLGSPTNKPPRRKHTHTSTQTDLRGLGWSTLNLSTRPPTPIPAFTHPPTRHPPSREHISIEAAYREGFKAGKRSASAQPRTSGRSSPLIPPASATRPWPQISPPRPVSQHRGFEVPTARARDDRRASSHSGARGGERRERPQPQPQHSWVKAFLRRGRET